jgi:hypothetical protein
VYFQDSVAYPFHYNFAAERLDPFLNIARPAFDAITLTATGQQLQLGTVLFPPGSPQGVGPREFAVQLIRNDAIPREQVVAFVNTVASKINASPPATALYMPTFEQTAAAAANAAYFAANGITVSSPARWATGNRVYAEGWTIGVLRFIPAAQVQSAYNTGLLRPEDVLLTDAVPAELPLVAGIISLSPATPNSHVALLAQTYGIPFAHLALPADAADAQAMNGRRVLLRADVAGGVSVVTLHDIEATVPTAFQEQLLALRNGDVPDITPTEPRGLFALNTDTLTPDDIRYVGGKAANYGFLRRSIPGNARRAVAITFDVWNAFMDQTVAGGGTLRQKIAARLAPHTWPPNFAQLSTALAAIRADITSTSATSFSLNVQQGVMAALTDPQYGFDPNIKIRFRSSTNVEDLSSFTGAGLYDSFSGCLRDDTDSDTAGPSWCDPGENNERGVFRAIRKVFASFYNDNAYTQRLRLGIDENEVGMALLCHHSFPDADEMANGVATYDRAIFPAEMDLVSQLGATSITNPTDGSIPEEVRVLYYGGNGIVPFLMRPSNRVPLGESVAPFPDVPVALAGLFVEVGNRIALETGDATSTLDFEYKRMAPFGSLDIKQVRKLPRPSTEPSVVPALVATPETYCLFQGEYGNVLSNHRLKALFRTTARNTILNASGLSSSLFASGTFDFNAGCSVGTFVGPPSAFPNANYVYEPGDGPTGMGTTHDSWSTGPSAGNPTTYTLSTGAIPSLVAPAQSPVLTLQDVGEGPRSGLVLSAVRSQPVETVDVYGIWHLTTTEDAVLCPRSKLVIGPLQQRTYVLPRPDGEPGGAVQVDTRFFWTQPPVFPVDFYTADLAAWDRTIITGLTSTPITLRGEFSQTYRPSHHNSTEWFVFEPGLEADLPAQQRAELNALGVTAIYLYSDPAGVNLSFRYLTNGLPCTNVCDSLDFNRDGNIEPLDVDAYFSVLGEGPCVGDIGNGCNDLDFNNDGNIEPGDVDAYFSVLGEGPCI